MTFSKDIAPILFQYCAPCHRPHEAGPFPLLSYQDARRHAAQIVNVTERRYMPPWPPEPGHGDFAGVRRLSQEQIALLARWAQSGMPEGDPAAMPPTPRFVEGWQIGQPDLVLHMSHPYQLAADGADVFRNFVIPVSLKETKYVRAMELRPGDKRVVHHANLILDRSRMLRRRDSQDGKPGFAGMDVETEVTGEFDPDSHFLFWKPGSPPEEEPADMPWKLDPGSDLIVNLHMRPSGKPETVSVDVGLYFADHPPTRFPMLLQLEHDGAIDIPPGSAQFVVTDRLNLPVDVDLLAIYPHAHYLGKQVEAWAELPGGGRKPLLQIDDWNINWQATYTYRAPVPLPAGTTVAMRISYDNTAHNPRNPNSPPKRIRSGNRSEDEMGHVWLQVLPATSDGDDPRLLLQKALMLRRIEKYPADFSAHFNLGAALQALGKHQEALPYLAQAVKISPRSATARNNLAVSLLVEERIDEAIREFRESLKLDPAYHNARFNLARALRDQGDATGALEQFLTFLKAVPDDAQAHEITGHIYISMGKLAESLPHFRKAVELEPNDTSLATNLGVALAMTGDIPAAIAAFESALRADPANQTAKDNLARARASLGKKP
ncbi:MAG TPA: tetratricopeptide repeat protein [Bryobacteraceae bacterium]|nr:tetratricopeptide repeat protein [Bryobacteraceae bacterium]